MRLYRDRAVVLRQHKLGEADRIVTLLTREHGLVRAVAKGVRRTRSKFGARLEPFAHIDVQLHPGRNLDIVTQVQADRRVRHRHRQRLRPLHQRLRGAGDRRAAGRRGTRPGARAAPADRRGAAGGGRRDAAPRAGARRLPVAGHGDRRLGARARPNAPAAPLRARTGRSTSPRAAACACTAGRRVRRRRRRACST